MLRLLSHLLLPTTVFVLLLAACAGQPRNTPGGTPVVLPTVDAATGGQDPAVNPILPTPTLAMTITAGGFHVEAAPVQFILAQETVNIRQGPGTDHAVLGQVQAGMIARVTGINPEGTWWQVVCPDESLGDCWVSADPALTTAAGVPGEDAPPGAVPIHETGDATVESIAVRTLESLPVQVEAVLRGYLPDSCTAITDLQQVREGTTFRIRMSTQRTGDQACAQALAPFEQVIALDIGGLPAGAYQVAVNDLWTSFELASAVSDQPVYPVIESTVSYILARSDLSIFSGPGSQFSRLGHVAAGMTAQVTGASPDGQWWRVICPDNSIGDCWISADQALTETITPTSPPMTTTVTAP
jgi:uncharacterized protein YgiM (DUF1202 family)